MAFTSYRNVLDRYGVWACIQDIFISALNKLVFFRVLLIYVKDRPSQIEVPHDINFHILSEGELVTYANNRDLELPTDFLRAAAANRDVCIGAFVGGNLCAYAWYAISPPTFADGTTALFSNEYAYAYKNLTLPALRGRGVQKFIKEIALEHFSALGKKGILVAIDSLNHASSSSTRNSGARLVGIWPYFKGPLWISGWTLGSKTTGFRMIKAPPLGTDITVECITDLDILFAEAHPYKRWVEHLPKGQGFTYRYEWVKNIGPLYLANNKKAFFLLARRDGQLIGVAPLMREVKPLSALGLRRLYFWGGIQGSLNNMLGEFLIPNEADIQPCMEAFRNYLYADARRQWDFMELSYLAADSHSLPLLRNLFPGSAVTKESMQRFTIDLCPAFDDFCNRLHRKAFSDIKRCRRKLNEAGANVEVLGIAALDDALIEQLAQIHSARQDNHRSNGTKRHSLFERSQDNAAFRELLKSSTKADFARHYLLKINGKIASFFLGFATGDVYHLFLTAFDAQFAEYGPTKMLLLDVCRTEIEQHDTRQITLSTGESRYKREFANLVIDNFRFEHVNPRPIAKLRYNLYRGLKKLR